MQFHVIARAVSSPMTNVRCPTKCFSYYEIPHPSLRKNEWSTMQFNLYLHAPYINFRPICEMSQDLRSCICWRATLSLTVVPG